MTRALFQHTVAAPAVCSGVGVHTGQPARLTIRPAPAGSGITFVRTDPVDGDPRVTVSPEAVVQTRLGTVIGNAGGVTVATIEHLMSAFVMTGVDNATVELDGPEVPIMDGSAAPFLALIDRVGLRPQGAARRYIEVLQTVEARDGDKRAALTPASTFGVDVEIAFASAAIGRQRVVFDLDEATYRREIARARTFGFVEEVEALRRVGLARGGSLANAVVVDGDRVLNPEGLRFADEPVRHKVLDAIGDLYVLGAPVIGRFEGRYTGHGLNNALVRALVARPAAWRWRVPAEAMAEAV